MTNESIAEHFDLLSKLMDIHADNSFKSKSYANAAFQIDRLPQQLAELDKKEWAGLKGIGANIAAKIDELLTTGKLTVLDEYIAKTPEGVIEFLRIKGLGPKKIHTVWKEMEIESIGELLYACNENRLVLYKGFGEKTQQNVKDAILFMMAQQGKFLYQQAEAFALLYEQKLKDIFKESFIGITGGMRRHDDIISGIDFLIALPAGDIVNIMQTTGHHCNHEADELVYPMENAPSLVLHSCNSSNKGSRLMMTTGHETFLKWVQQKTGTTLEDTSYENEEEIFKEANLPFILPQHRETSVDENYYRKYSTLQQADVSSIKAIIHSHSKWSDGSHSLEEMAMAAKDKGFEYLVISDHSKAATYAGGLSVERVFQQQEEIDRLNRSLAPFKIFKSIECDILGNGQLDYDDDVLQSFDLVIASVHSSLKMSEEKAMQRLLTAIENPYTVILGHMTGRLLLSRNGYPIDHKKIIDACAANNVVIELNAHPRRLDIDWTWIPYALEKEVLISINPDAHSIEGFDDIKYGCIAAEKALLPAASNLSSFPLQDFEQWLYDTRVMKGTLG
ncbi:MAG: PHP domain-containing protein [Chitinophagaceae bacterium]|nr:PHP domain-containing protein [Chitinophagaceae bacterium]